MELLLLIFLFILKRKQILFLFIFSVSLCRQFYVEKYTHTLTKSWIAAIAAAAASFSYYYYWSFFMLVLLLEWWLGFFVVLILIRQIKIEFLLLSSLNLLFPRKTVLLFCDCFFFVVVRIDFWNVSTLLLFYYLMVQKTICCCFADDGTKICGWLISNCSDLNHRVTRFWFYEFMFVFFLDEGNTTFKKPKLF